MERMEWVAAVASAGGLLGGAFLLAVAIVVLCRSAGDGVAQFTYGHLATFGVLIGIVSGLLLVQTVEPYVASSLWAVAAVVVVNVLLQPLALLLGWTGVRKLTLGLSGCVAHAWRRIPESELRELTVTQRRELAWYCVLQGLVALPFGVGIGIPCAWPLLQLATT